MTSLSFVSSTIRAAIDATIHAATRTTVTMTLIGSILGATLTSSPAHAGMIQERLPDWLRLSGDYRVETLHIHPLGLSDERVRAVTWTEQRLRTDLGLTVPKWGGVFVQLDILDGVLFGDNGDFGHNPEPSSGLAVTSRWPNDAGWDVGLYPGADPLKSRSYGPRLRSIAPIELRRAYADVYLPIGLVRIGRQPINYGATISGHEGGRLNRWGVSRYAQAADRVLFATKLDQLALAIRDGFGASFDTRTDRGLILLFAYDWATQDDIYRSEDDLHQVTMGLQWLVPEAHWFGVPWRHFVLSGNGVYRWGEEFETSIGALPLRLAAEVGPVSIDLQYTLLAGASREISEGFAALQSKAPRRQRIIAMGAHAQVDWKLGPVELTFQLDYASGDDDPRSTTDLTSYTYPRDLNVGLLLFEHVLAFESARSAAVGIENLAELGADSFPVTEIATEGRFTNAIALFPQLRINLVDTGVHEAHARLGVLVAWPAAAGGAVDPIQTALAEDGDRVDDDAVNFHGGRPGHYYGTEVDLQIQWTYRSFFAWTIESAVLFPGSSLEDENGDATLSFLVENRFEFLF